MSNIFTLSSIARFLNLEICACSQCMKIEEEISQFLAPGPAWHSLLSTIQRLSNNGNTCDLLSSIATQTKGSLCWWDICPGCFQTGSAENNARIAYIRSIVDVSDFEVTAMSNSEGKCPVHGSFMTPFCLGDPPKVMLLLSECQVSDRHILFRPLHMMWNGIKFTPTNRSKYIYVPSPTRWPLNIVYNVKAEVIQAPGDSGTSLRSKMSQSYTYLLERVTSPLNTFSSPLHTVLSDPAREHELWLVFQCILGASNGGYSVLGKPIFRSTSTERDVLTTTKETPVPSSNGGRDPNLSTSIPELIETLEKSFGKTDDIPRADSSSHHSGSIFSPTGETSSCSDLCSNVDDEDLDDVLGTLKTLSFHSPEMSSTRYPNVDGSDSEAAGDPSYSPEVNMGNNTGSDMDGSCCSDERKYGQSPKQIRKLRFIFDRETAAAEKKERQKEVTSDGSGEEIQSPSESAISRPGFVEATNYRVPILRAPASHFKDPLQIDSRRGRDNTISPEEALLRLQSGTLPLVRSSLLQGPHIDFTSSSSMNSGAGSGSLQFHVDVDSIDFVTISLGGTAFHISNARIPLTWQRNFLKEREIAESNNGFTAFLAAYSSEYPGDYFGTDVNTSVKTRRFRGYQEDAVLNSPMQLQILEIMLGWTQPLRVYAIFPSKCSIFLLKGSGALLELFLLKKNGWRLPHQQQKLNARHTLSEMVWYILTSAVLFFCDIGTKDGTSPGVWFRPSCCAFTSVLPLEDILHDKKCGHLSDSNFSQKLSPGSLTVALCLFARHQKAIEQHSMLPRYFQCSDLRNVDKYRLDTKLYPIVNPTLLPVLQADIGSQTCLTWFQRFWSTTDTVWGDIVALRSDSDRRDEDALPSQQSNIQALRKGKMCLEDLLCFNHVIFRGTLHGAKETAYNKHGLENIKEVLMKTLHPSCFQDGTADVGYVFHSSSDAGNDDFTLHLNRKVVAAGQILLPESANRSPRECGAYLTSTTGFPYFVGYSTRKGKCADLSSSITPYGVRKVKAYSTKWRADSFRGKTVYSTPRANRVQKQLSNAKGLYELCLKNQGKHITAEVHRLEADVKYMLHNNSYRAGNVSSFQNRIGVRMEYTCFFDSSFQFLNEPLELLSLQDDGRSVSVPDEAGECKEIERSPLPWWKDYRLSSSERSKFPFIAVSRRTMHSFSLLLEKRLLSLSLEIFKAGMRLLTNGTELTVSDSTLFLQPILGQLGTMAAAKFVSVMSSAMYRAAFYEVNSMICRIPHGIPSSPDGYLLSSGAMASIWFSGYPTILLSRMCRFPAFSTGYQVMLNGNTSSSSVSLEQAILVSTDDDFVLPRVLSYNNILSRSEVRYLQLATSQYDSGPDTVVHFLTKIMGVWYRSQTDDSTDIRFLSFSLATITVRFLIRDLFETMRALEDSVSERHSGSRVQEAQMDENLTSIQLTNQLTNDCIGHRMWPQEYRFCRSSSNLPVGDAIDTLCSAFYLQNNAVLVLPGSGWTRRTLHVDKEGFISDKDFIDVLWSTAESVASNPPSSDRNIFPEGYNTRRWLSVYGLQVAMQMCKLKENESMFRTFSKHFREGLSAGLWCAAFGRACPAFQKKCSGILRNTLGLWGPDMLFCRMKFISHDSEQPCPNPDSGVPDTESIESIQGELKSIWESLDGIQKSRLSHQLGSPTWIALSKRYSDVSRSFWNIPDIDDLIISYIQKFFENEKRQGILQDLDLTWIMKLVFSLIQLRKNSTHEGLSARRTSAQEVLVARDAEISSTTAELLKYPWRTIYPNPESVYKKRSRVKQVNKVLSRSFPLLFKVGTKTELARNVGEEVLRKCMQFTVEDVYGQLKDTAKAGSSLAHWRLCPTRLIALALLNENV